LKVRRKTAKDVFRNPQKTIEKRVKQRRRRKERKDGREGERRGGAKPQCGLKKGSAHVGAYPLG